MSEKKPFKFEMWMLGAAIVPVGIGIALYSWMQRDSVDLGGECSAREQCKKPADACMDVGEAEVCTMMCSFGSPCPAGFECVTLDVTFQNQGGFTDVKDMQYCFETELVEKMSR